LLDLQLTFQAQVVHDLAQLRRCTDDEVGIEANSELNANGEASTGFEFGDHLVPRRFQTSGGTVISPLRRDHFGEQILDLDCWTLGLFEEPTGP
jgi:hypothetical protein